MKLPAISKTGPLTNFWTPIPAKINIETIIIMINNVWPISPCNNTKNKHTPIKNSGAAITLIFSLTCGNFLLITYEIYNMNAIFNNSDACKFINPRFIQLLEPLIFLPTISVKNSNTKMIIMIHFCVFAFCNILIFSIKAIKNTTIKLIITYISCLL